jgi:membrane-bound lytic murein transglycosylase D
MKFLLLVVVLSLTACQLTSPDQVEQQPTPEATPDLFACASDLNASTDSTSFGSCETEPEAMEGVATIIHPLDAIEIAIVEPELETSQTFTNLWDRVENEFTFPIPTDQARLDSQRKWFLRHPAYMSRVSKRAKPFLYYIVERLEAEGMPLELALLPIVESAFDPFAYSHGRASGMWQFIPSTGKRFGMKQTWWYDGRRDVIASTEGAIKYLRYLNNMFDGDWLHALAAYNSGEGRVMRAIKKNRNAGKPTDFWSLSLPRETRAYVPKLLALADILRNNDKYNFAWPSIANAPVVETVEIGSQIDLALAASMAELSIAELQALNPGFNRWATDPAGPHSLLLPLDKSEAFASKLAQTSSKDRLNWVRHKVRNGDSLGVIASKYSSSIDVIKQVNNLRSNTIYVNDYVLVPVSLKKLDDYSLSADQRLVKTQSIERAEHKIQHKVESGDTLWDIAMAHKVGVRNLAKWNKMAPTDPLKVGKTLVVWTDQVPVPNANSPVMRNVVYTVRNGDSLARIATKFKVKVADLTKWNKLNSNKYLQPGQKLKIKVDVTRT